MRLSVTLSIYHFPNINMNSSKGAAVTVEEIELTSMFPRNSYDFTFIWSRAQPMHKTKARNHNVSQHINHSFSCRACLGFNLPQDPVITIGVVVTPSNDGEDVVRHWEEDGLVKDASRIG